MASQAGTRIPISVAASGPSGDGTSPRMTRKNKKPGAFLPPGLLICFRSKMPKDRLLD